MAARLKIVVDVDDSAFREYVRLHKQYADVLKGQPAQGSKIAAASKQAANDSERAAKSVADYSDNTEKAASFGGKLRQQVEITQRHFHQLKLSTQGMAAHIGDATKSLLQWSGILGIVGGIAGYATVQGFNNLASSAQTQRMGSMSIGADVGKVNAFRLNFQRLGMDGFLENLATNRTTPEGRAGLYGLGFGDKDIALETPDLGNRLLGRIKNFVDRTDESSLGTQLKAHRLDQYLSPEQALRLKHMSREEFQQLQRDYKSDAKKLSVGDEDLQAWQKLRTAVDKASAEIEKTFIVGLAPVAEWLGGVLDKLSGPTEELKEIPEWVEEQWAPVSDAIKKFDELNPEVAAFKKGVAEMAEVMKDYLLPGLYMFERLLGVGDPTLTERMIPFARKLLGRPKGGGGGEGGGSYKDSAERMKKMKADPQDEANNPPGFNAQVKKLRDAKRNEAARGGKGGLKGIIDRAAAAEGVDPHILYGIVAGESGHGDKYDTNFNGEESYGPFQFNMHGGLGVDLAKEGIDVRDPKSIPAQARWLARRIKNHGSLSPWRGYHGNRDWDPSWGRMGVVSDDKAATNVRPKDPSHGRGAISHRRHEDLMGSEGHRGGDAIMGSAHVQVDVHHAPGRDADMNHALAATGAS